MLPLLAAAAIVWNLAQDPLPSAESLAPHAAGICLAQVTKIELFDARPMDGNMGLNVTLKPRLASGEVPEYVVITLEHSGFRPPSAPPPKPDAPLKDDSLVVGRFYWFAFSSRHERDTFNQGIINYWPQPERDAAPILEKAARADEYRWHPQYHPSSGITWGYLTDPSNKNALQVRVTKGEHILWTRTFEGASPQLHGFGLQDFGNSSYAPRCGNYLAVPAKRRLADTNDFNVPPGEYTITEFLDPQTGTAGTIDVESKAGIVVHREYNCATKVLESESRFDFPNAGGIRLGNKTERWYRKIHQTFSPDGTLTSDKTYWYDETIKDSSDRWVEVR